MKTRALVLIVLAAALSVAPQLFSAPSAAGTYSAKLISPRIGQILYPGQKIMIEWKSTLPKIDLTGSEMELFLSVDGGRTFDIYITPIFDAKTTSYLWTVPNTPTNAAVLDIRFGCEGLYPETCSPQPASTFVIAKALPASR